MNTIGLGNALVDVLLRLENDDVLSEIGIQKGAMDMINRGTNDRYPYNFQPACHVRKPREDLSATRCVRCLL